MRPSRNGAPLAISRGQVNARPIASRNDTSGHVALESVLSTDDIELKRHRRVRTSFLLGQRIGRRRTTHVARAQFAAFAALADVVTIVSLAVGIGVAYHTFFYHVDGIAGPAFALGTMMAALFVAFNVLREEYTIGNYLTLAGHARRVILTWNMTFVTALVFVFAMKETSDFSRASIVLFYLLGLFGLFWLRTLIVLRTKANAFTGKVATLRVVLVGEESELRAFTARYQPWTVGIDIIASAVLRGPDTLADDLALAAASARVLRPDDIYILMPWSRTDAIDACVSAFMNVPASIHLGPQRVLDKFTKASVSRIGTIASLHLVRPPLTTTEVIKKRTLDVLLASAMLIGLMPFFLLVALIIKLDSPGPIFFLQRRYGFNQETFRILKFRTMSVAEDDIHLVQATRDDPRVTRFGRVLRRFNIDEFPQLLNVLRGDMSLVGPRPHALVHNQHYERSIADYARRHNMKPGLTGWAQIHGLRGEIRNEIAMRQRVEHDIYYIENWSVGLDLRILAMTLVSAKAFENAF